MCAAFSVLVGLIALSVSFAPVPADAVDLVGRFAHRDVVSLAGEAQAGLIAENFEVLGHVNLPGGSPHADVSFHDHGTPFGKFAYLGTWSGVCSGTGVKIIDVNNPANPKLVAIVEKSDGTSTEDMTVVRIGDQDVLGIGLQRCRAPGLAGLALWDVTNPMKPVRLSFLPLPVGVHELDMVVRGDGRALALLATPFAEGIALIFGEPAGKDFRIADITDPSRPRVVAEWGVVSDGHLRTPTNPDVPLTTVFQSLGYFGANFAHSARAADGGRTAYVSYWDMGVLKLDISVPERPVLVGRTVYSIADDGNAHSLAILDVGKTRYLLQNDEDGDFLSPALASTSANPGAQYAALEHFVFPTLLSETGPLTREVHDAADGCDAADYAGTEGKIVLVDSNDPFYVGIVEGWTVPCTLGTQILLAADAGATAVIINLLEPVEFPDGSYIYFQGDFRAVQEAAFGMPVVVLSFYDGMAEAIRAAVDGAVTATLMPQPPHFGFLRVYREGRTDVDRDRVFEFQQVGMLELPGELIHNTEVLGDRAYHSWYTFGIIASDIGDPTNPLQVGQFVPPSSSTKAGSLGPGPALVWGVAIDPQTGILYVSDMRSGLWIVRPTGSAA